MIDVPGTEYIYHDKRKDWYRVLKKIKGKMTHFGGHKSLICALMIRDWCIEDGWSRPYPKPPHEYKSKYRCVDTYIYKYIGEGMTSYTIQRKIHGKTQRFGVYKTLENALVMRDYLDKTDWQRLPSKPTMNITKIQSGKYMIFKCNSVDGVRHKTSYGVFDCLSDAVDELEKIKSVGWDFDAWCELVDERVDDETVWLNRRVY